MKKINECLKSKGITMNIKKFLLLLVSGLTIGHLCADVHVHVNFISDIKDPEAYFRDMRSLGYIINELPVSERGNYTFDWNTITNQDSMTVADLINTLNSNNFLSYEFKQLIYFPGSRLAIFQELTSANKKYLYPLNQNDVIKKGDTIHIYLTNQPIQQ